ncbi:MAG: FtsQ-type POTRA domain-containing protein [Gammaproteobacteria bacterium]|nr:FtsQ-type POTRA domain-containing protein [Gammaproteobacteria bacterium]
MAKRLKRNQRRTMRENDAMRIDFREVGKLLSVALVVIAGIWATKRIEDISIKTIEIQTALNKVSKSEIRTIAENYMHDGFFTVDLSSFEDQLNDIPWVYRANIKRQWPSKLVIEISEQQPYFRWGENHLINKYAEIFFVQDIQQYAALPLLQGVRGREQHLIDLYYKYSARFKKVDSGIHKLKEDARYDKEIILVNGISINVGREQTDKQIERCLYSFAMFTKAEREAIASIDLRHSNGFAVRWNG